jgi:acetyl esterase
MTQIDSEVRAVLDQMNAAMPAASDFDVTAFRAAVEAQPAPPSTTTLAAIDNRSIPGPGGPLPLRLYRPNLDQGQPVILFFRGGGFIQRGLDSHDETCRRLAVSTHSTVCAVDYRPAPEDPFPAAVDDAYAAVEHIDREASSLGLDRTRIAVAGDSAGAAIAAGTALRCRDTGGPHIYLQFLRVPMLRHREDTPSRRTYGQGDHGITTQLLDWYSDQYAPGPEAADPYCAPLRATDLRHLPPAYIHTAELDPLRDDGADYANRLRAAGVHVEHRVAPGLFHGFHFFADTLPQAHDEVTSAHEALRRLLSPDRAGPMGPAGRRSGPSRGGRGAGFATTRSVPTQ